MNYYDEELQRLQQEMMEKERADAKLADLYIQQNELEKKAAEFRKIMEEEQEDVERLKRTNLTALFYRASGKMEEKLSKEEEEALAAVVKYDSAEKELQKKILHIMKNRHRGFRTARFNMRGCLRRKRKRSKNRAI